MSGAGSTKLDVPVLCVYGPQHVASLRDVLVPALALQQMPEGCALSLHVMNYRGNVALFDVAAPPGLAIHDWSAARPDAHIGFGEAVNRLFEKAAPQEFFFLINPDSFPMDGCLAKLIECHRRHPSAGIIEASQWPSEHPKEYDRETLETPWASGAFNLIAADAFKEVGGFDPVYFLYNEDVDLSWRMWLAGHPVLYAPDAWAAHFTGLFSYRADRYYYEHFFTGRNFIALSYKFFGEAGEARAIDFLRSTGYPERFKEGILASYAKMKPTIRRFAGEVLAPQCKITGFNLYHECRSF